MHRRSEVLKYSKIINEVSPRLATQVYSTETRRDDVLYSKVRNRSGNSSPQSDVRTGINLQYQHINFRSNTNVNNGEQGIDYWDL